MTTEAVIPVGRTGEIRADIAGKPRVGTVLFAHGSGSSRHSPRNRHVADVLQDAGLQTVLLDLLTEEEGQRDLVTGEHRFDIRLLTDRVLLAMEWLVDRSEAAAVGVFGASTGAAAALRAAAARPGHIGAVVSRGGRPDMAEEALARVSAPTLLIVGGLDRQVLGLNEGALAALNDASTLEVIEGATHLFEEPGKLDRVAELASNWFVSNLGSSP